MPLTLPNLDDRRWTDLVDEGRSLLPVYAPGWTDHNLHDPGITLMELFAWLTELDLYRINRVPPTHRRKFLELLGFAPRGAVGARLALGVELTPGAPLELAAGLEVDARSPTGEIVRFVTDKGLTAVPGRLVAVQIGDGSSVSDQTSGWRRGEPVRVLGADPAIGAALYLGFSEPPPAGIPVSLRFEIEGGDDGARRALAFHRADRRCGEPPVCERDGSEHCGDGGDVPAAPAGPLALEPANPPHHSARLVWEAAGNGDLWRPVTADDDTRALTLSGRVTLTLPAPPLARRIGEVADELFYVRCRLAGGALDAAPRVTAILLNGLSARQEVAVGSWSWELVAGAAVDGPEPNAGANGSFDLELDGEGRITRLAAGSAEAPELFVLDWLAPTPTDAGRLTVEASPLGTGTGLPVQRLELPRAVPVDAGLTVFSHEEGGWRSWRRRADFGASSRADADFVLEPRPGGAPAPAFARFGDGERGRTLPRGARAWIAYRSTLARDGNVAAGALEGLADSPRNRALVSDLDGILARVAGLASPLAAAGGADGESLDDTALRALEAVEETGRAVTLTDFEKLARSTPGVRLARAEARAALHPAFPCFEAPGVVTVLVLPRVPTVRPSPSRGLLAAVAAHLNRRRTLGTRVEVTGPHWIEVTVHARVMACPGVDPDALATRLTRALDDFFHPLGGGPDARGWPFGRTVYASEVYQVLDETAGAEHVLELALAGADGKPGCENLCLPPNGLVASGKHAITVEGGGARPC